MIDFTTLRGLTIPEGVVTQITDESGRVIWAVQSGDKVVLQVAKQTLDTYAGETKYTGESFVAIDVYPKTNGTVKVTYGGLTKTIKDTSGAEKPNAQTVYFGTLYGVSDSVETSASGTLTIEGNFCQFGAGLYYEQGNKGKMTAYCGCITSVSEWGEITSIPQNCFNNCNSLNLSTLPSQITSIGKAAFMHCEGITSFVVPEGITHIENDTFKDCYKLTTIIFPSTLKTLGSGVVHKTVNVGGSVPYTVKMLAKTPPSFTVTGESVAAFAFIQVNGTNSGNIVVPKGCGNAYKTAEGWNYYANKIVEAT